MAGDVVPVPAPRRLYLDTSAYLCILLAEQGADRLSRETAGAELCASVLLVLESRRTLVRLAREGALSAEQYQKCLGRLDEDIAALTLRDLTLDLSDAPAMPAVATPRSLDLAHLRTALWFDAERPLDRFVTTDRTLEAAAAELGLRT